MQLKGVSPPPPFVAIDFETADQGSDSACAVGLVKVVEGKITARLSRLIRPPRPYFLFTAIHGITWQDVAAQPRFPQLWPEISEFIRGAEFLAAHNSGFDRRVLHACCSAAGIAPPAHNFLCTVQLARKAWGIRPTKLPDVCARLGIKLNHHEALSDAQACAEIVLAAYREGPVKIPA